MSSSVLAFEFRYTEMPVHHSRPQILKATEHKGWFASPKAFKDYLEYQSARPSFCTAVETTSDAQENGKGKLALLRPFNGERDNLADMVIFHTESRQTPKPMVIEKEDIPSLENIVEEVVLNFFVELCKKLGRRLGEKHYLSEEEMAAMEKQAELVKDELKKALQTKKDIQAKLANRPSF